MKKVALQLGFEAAMVHLRRACLILRLKEIYIPSKALRMSPTM
jgi:hypothetical protein